MRSALNVLLVLAGCSTGPDSEPNDTGADSAADTGCSDPISDTASLLGDMAVRYCLWLEHCATSQGMDDESAHEEYEKCMGTQMARCVDACDTSARACIDGIDLTRECLTWDDMVTQIPDECFTVTDCE